MAWRIFEITNIAFHLAHKIRNKAGGRGTPISAAALRPLSLILKVISVP